MRFWDSSAILPLIAEARTSDYATRYYEANPELVVWWGCQRGMCLGTRALRV